MVLGLAAETIAGMEADAGRDLPEMQARRISFKGRQRAC
jgi:hypothetical protein